MKYKLTQEAIEEINKIMNSISIDSIPAAGQPIYFIHLMQAIRDQVDMELKLIEKVAEKLPKPRLKSIDDFVALEGWEYQWEHTPHWIWWASKITCNSLEELYTAKIRQIDMPENEYLVKDCIEQETKEPISIADYQAHKDREFESKVREIIKKVLKEEAGE